MEDRPIWEFASVEEWVENTIKESNEYMKEIRELENKVRRKKGLPLRKQTEEKPVAD